MNPIASIPIADSESLPNNYSDHNILNLNIGNLKLRQLNVAQLGRLQLFSNEGKIVWSSTLRTTQILKLLVEKKELLNELSVKFLEYVNNPHHSLEEKNSMIEDHSKQCIPILIENGFTIKSLKMYPNKAFNPNISPALIHANPEAYIKAPYFVLEDNESFAHRMKKAFGKMFKCNSDIITCQEIEIGEADGINFSSTLESCVADSPYTYVLPDINYQSSATIPLTFFHKGLFKDVSTDEKYLEMLNFLKKQIVVFGDSETKNQILLLQECKTLEVYPVVNIHADYPKSNTIETWKVFRQVFDQTPNLIVGGDFNLKLDNRSYFTDAFSDFKGRYTILKTPEPIDIGNPTYDLILSNVIDIN